MRPADWLDERMHLGETPESRQEEASRRAASAEGEALRRDLTESDAEILRRLPPERMAERIRARAEARRSVRGIRVRTAWVPLALAACALALGLFVTPIPSTLAPAAVARSSRPAPDTARSAASTDSPANVSRPQERVAMVEAPVDPGVRVRGEQDLSLLAVDPSGAVSETDSVIPAGTTLRVKVPARAHAAVWSFDETGTLVRHWPLSGDSATALPAGALPRDWQTDPTAGWERFVLVWSDGAFPLATAEAHLKGLLASGRSGTRRISLPSPLRVEAVRLARTAP